MDDFDNSIILCQFDIGGVNDRGVDVLLLNITSLSFYCEPDLLPEWYLATLMLFYAISPLLKILLEKGGWSLLLMIGLTVVIEEEIWGTGKWQYANAIARFPLYLLGMLCAIKNKEDLPYKVTILLFLLSIVFFFQNHHYLFSACSVLLLIQVANKLIDRWSFFKNKIFNWIGTHTLELYVGNVLSAVMMRFVLFPELHVLVILTIDLTMTTGFSLLLWKVNSQIQKIV